MSNCTDLSDGTEFEISGDAFLDTFISANRSDKEELKTKTELAELLVNAGWKPFTVTFEKADGSLRTLVGKLVKPEPLLGRSLVTDFNVDDDDRFRFVDHRTIQSLVMDGVRYILKDPQQRKVSPQSSKHHSQPRDSFGRFTVSV